jgi:acyl-coenzyme A synthetase/AMP-(fatty) acid ligase
MSAVVETGLETAPRLRALVTGAPSRVVAWERGVAVSRDTFERHVRAAAAALPTATYAINLCDDRYRFIVALAAAALRRQVTLLPSSRAPAVIDAVLAEHPDAICIGEGDHAPQPPQYWRLPEVLDELDGPPLEIDGDAALLVGFTSGSTGRPTPNRKTLASFVTSTAIDEAWTLLPGVRLSPQPDGTLVDAPHLASPVALADIVELLPGGRFRLCGRNADLLEIAGKRASLGDLTRKLLAVPGVDDGVVVQLDAEANGVRRIAALAVAPALSPDAILRALRMQMDPVFLPRRQRCLASLPRNETGTLPREQVLALLRE